ncbi:MAG: hypothetical protein JW885_15775 [Deltaproteobacteria bacterium]|nr:hypothetical protein [Candidatus Zymogenaceae bacterium]
MRNNFEVKIDEDAVGDILVPRVEFQDSGDTLAVGENPEDRTVFLFA